MMWRGLGSTVKMMSREWGAERLELGIAQIGVERSVVRCGEGGREESQPVSQPGEMCVCHVFGGDKNHTTQQIRNTECQLGVIKRRRMMILSIALTPSRGLTRASWSPVRNRRRERVKLELDLP